MIGMDILEFRDINQPAVMPKYVIIGQIDTWECEYPPPASLELKKVSSQVGYLLCSLSSIENTPLRLVWPV